MNVFHIQFYCNDTFISVTTDKVENENEEKRTIVYQLKVDFLLMI